jgi:hypothetical protein
LTDSGVSDILPDLAINHFTGRNTMTEQALELFVDSHENILMDDNIEESCLAFRDESLAFYQNNPRAVTKVPYDVIDKINEEQLMHAIRTGLMVDVITRITGYFSKKSQWNPGKLAELKDRRKFEVTESGCNSACPISQGE